MRAPGPLALLGLAAVVIAFSTDHPLVLLAVAAGALTLFLRAPGRPSRLFLIGGLTSGLTLALINPFVSAQGDLILWSGPEVALFDLEITLEELLAGAAVAVRLFAVATLAGALLASIDADRLQAQVARVAPHSALVCALAARLLPTLERDARAITEAARLRGVALTDGSWTRRLRRAAPLALPLLGSGLERGMDVAEAMAVRGYGGGPRTRVREAAYTGVERGVLAIGAGLVAVAVAMIAGGPAQYDFYPTLDDPLGAGAIAIAALVLAALCAASQVLRR